ncbi:hypothetical protein JOC86_004178 [Bacillus pakistanensis]|uniref:NADH dehydrogenase subunit 3 n=1 Tax=Rossellomorea pakistanensis TaxID=992288 RepID=A0ABS2NIB6_9BACI|nr:hypothetical protein [Bacillus pakistanensis]MBM7587604.1 hypothetical protein [Bacillus pakistanensis]
MKLTKHTLKILISLIAGMLLTIASAILTVEKIENRDELHHLQFGLPIPFVYQHNDWLEPPNSELPKEVQMFSPTETPTDFNLLFFFLDFLLISGFIYLVIWGTSKLRNSRKGRD